MKKQQILAKWQSIFASMNAPLLEAEFEKDITELLGDADTISDIIYELNDFAESKDTNEYGLPIHDEKLQIRMETIVKNILNNELD